MVDGIKIVDNFFPNVDAVRNYALNLRTYNPCDYHSHGIYSGYRTPLIDNDEIRQYVVQRIENISNRKVEHIRLTFHLNTEISVCGGPHDDLEPHDIKQNIIDRKFAGVIYLTPNPPANTGTTIYKNETPYTDDIHFAKLQIIYNVILPLENKFKKDFIKELRQFKESLEVSYCCENVYNRMILYPAKLLHSPDNYFGETLEDGRLSIAIHGIFAE